MTPRELLAAMKSERGHALLDSWERDRAQADAAGIEASFGVSPERFARMTPSERIDAAKAHYANKNGAL